MFLDKSSFTLNAPLHYTCIALMSMVLWYFCFKTPWDGCRKRCLYSCRPDRLCLWFFRFIQSCCQSYWTNRIHSRCELVRSWYWRKVIRRSQHSISLLTHYVLSRPDRSKLSSTPVLLTWPNSRATSLKSAPRTYSPHSCFLLLCTMLLKGTNKWKVSILDSVLNCNQ